MLSPSPFSGLVCEFGKTTSDCVPLHLCFRKFIRVSSLLYSFMQIYSNFKCKVFPAPDTVSREMMWPYYQKVWDPVLIDFMIPSKTCPREDSITNSTFVPSIFSYIYAICYLGWFCNIFQKYCLWFI